MEKQSVNSTETKQSSQPILEFENVTAKWTEVIY